MCPATRTDQRLDGRHWVRLPILLAIAIGTMFLGTETVCQDLPVLDLTKRPPADAKSLGVPGMAVGGVLGIGRLPLTPPRYPLPLAARIQAVHPSRVSASGEFVIELVLRNAGETPFYLPQSRDSWTVHAEGNNEKRAFFFSVRFFVPGKWEAEASVVASTSGAATLPDSLLRLNPQQSVLVLLPVRLTSIRHRLSHKAHDLSLQVICKEWTFEDDRYYIKTHSHELESENVFRISLQPENLPPHK